jgi:hypothetical protein
MVKRQHIYIDMCSAAQEIQKLWKPGIGDYYFQIVYQKVYLLTKQEIRERKFCRWLPTEKQLCKIYYKYGVFDWRKFDKVSSEFFDYLIQITGEHPTKEMCGLSAIMFYCFLKKWNNKDWIRN